jgi:hypothetical protein
MSAPVVPAAGLCERCASAWLVRTPRSAFWLCGLARFDARFDRYPRIPVLACPGFEALPEGETPPEGLPGRGSRE